MAAFKIQHRQKSLFLALYVITAFFIAFSLYVVTQHAQLRSSLLPTRGINVPKNEEMVEEPDLPHFLEQSRPANATAVAVLSDFDSVDLFVDSIMSWMAQVNQVSLHPVQVFFNRSTLLGPEIEKRIRDAAHPAEAHFHDISAYSSPARYPIKHSLDRHPSVLALQHMRRFLAGPVFWHPALDSYEWAWHLSTKPFDICQSLGDTVSALNGKASAYYAWSVMYYETHTLTTATLWESTQTFLKEKVTLFPQIRPIVEKIGMLKEPASRCFYWTSMEVARLDRFRSGIYREYFEYLDSTGGFFSRGWTDSHVRTFGIDYLLGSVSGVVNINMACPASRDTPPAMGDFTGKTAGATPPVPATFGGIEQRWCAPLETSIEQNKLLGYLPNTQVTSSFVLFLRSLHLASWLAIGLATFVLVSMLSSFPVSFEGLVYCWCAGILLIVNLLLVIVLRFFRPFLQIKHVRKFLSTLLSPRRLQMTYYLYRERILFVIIGTNALFGLYIGASLLSPPRGKVLAVMETSRLQGHRQLQGHRTQASLEARDASDLSGVGGGRVLNGLMADGNSTFADTTSFALHHLDSSFGLYIAMLAFCLLSCLLHLQSRR